MAEVELEVGTQAPNFELPATTPSGVFSSESLRGAPAVIYFYPKDATPGCTTQACDFRDHFNAFAEAGIPVIGISPDSLASHLRFKEKQGLNFVLVADESRDAARAYGVWQKKKLYGREYDGIVRTTYLLDADGVIRHVWKKVRVKGHVPTVLAAALELQGGSAS